MSKSPSSRKSNKGKQNNSPQQKTPMMHDDPQRRQPPTPQDIHRVQPISQTNQKDHIGKPNDSNFQKGKK